MAMPIASMNKNDCPEAGKDDVGTAWKTVDMEPEPESRCVQDFPNREFWFCVSGANGGHQGGPLRFRYSIHDSLAPGSKSNSIIPF
jgi:hypothetical protein